MNTAPGNHDEPADKQQPTIVVVEDVVLVRLVVAEQLRYHGFAVIEVSSADEAIRILTARVKADLVFSDVHLVGSSMDGFGLRRWIKDQRPEIKVLLASGEVPSPGPGGEVLLVKPYKYPELVRRIRDLLTPDTP